MSTSSLSSILDGRRPRRGGRTTRLPGGDGGSYYPHRRMGGVALGFVRPPQRITLRRGRWPLALEDQLVLRHGFVPTDRPAPLPATKTTTTTTTALGPKSNKGAGCQPHKSNKMRRRSATQSSTIAGRRVTIKRAVEKSKQQPTIAC